jgi:hypothetical protein
MKNSVADAWRPFERAVGARKVLFQRWVFLLLLSSLGIEARSGAEEPKEAEKPIDCDIIAIRQNPRMLVLNKGDVDGVKVGQEFLVYRGESYVARLKVTHTFDDMAVASILSEAQPIQNSDKVTSKIGKEEPKGTDDVPQAEPAGNVKLERKGRLLGVDARVNLVVVNLGKKDGLRRGTELIVARGEKWIANLVIERVQDSMAIAEITYKSEACVPGDVVYMRKKQ